MSKLSKKIRAAGRAEPAPLGFASLPSQVRQDSLLCGVRLRDPAAAAGAASSGADFVILEDVAHSQVKGVAKVKASVGVAGDFDSDALEALGEAGVDFVVLAGPGAGAAPLADQSVGRVMALDSDLDDTYLRLLGDLGLDALVIAAPEAPLTWSGCWLYGASRRWLVRRFWRTRSRTSTRSRLSSCGTPAWPASCWTTRASWPRLRSASPRCHRAVAARGITRTRIFRRRRPARAMTTKKTTTTTTSLRATVTLTLA